MARSPDRHSPCTGINRPTALIYSCVTRIAGKPFMLSFWSDEGSDVVRAIAVGVLAVGAERMRERRGWEVCVERVGGEGEGIRTVMASWPCDCTQVLPTFLPRPFQVLILGLDTSTAMCGELWLTSTEYQVLGFPARSSMKTGKILSEKKQGKIGPFPQTAEKMVCQAIRKNLGLVRQDDDQLYLQIPTITS